MLGKGKVSVLSQGKESAAGLSRVPAAWGGSVTTTATPPPTSGERWHGASTQQTRPAGCVELCRRGLSPAFFSHPGWGGHSLMHPKGWGPALQVHGDQSSLSPSQFLPSSLLECDSDALCQCGHSVPAPICLLPVTRQQLR